MFKLNIKPSGDSIYVSDEKSVLDHLKDNGIYVKNSCGGHASCSDCIIKVTDGKDNINEPTFAENKLLGNVFHITKERLACQCFVKGEVTIDISSHNKGTHEQSRQNKNRKMSQIKVRKKEEVEKIIGERVERSKEKQAKREDWKNHWEKEGVKTEKRLGGNRRPKGMKDLELEKERAEKKKSES